MGPPLNSRKKHGWNKPTRFSHTYQYLFPPLKCPPGLFISLSRENKTGLHRRDQPPNLSPKTFAGSRGAEKSVDVLKSSDLGATGRQAARGHGSCTILNGAGLPQRVRERLPS